LTYREVEPNVIEIEGTVPFYADGRYGPKQVKARLRHFGKEEFLLSSRGFHWVNEVPYNQSGPKGEPPPPIMPPPKKQNG
jgi:hypothetical protein